MERALAERTRELEAVRTLLHDSEERFHLVAKHAYDGINVCTYDPLTRRRRLIYCNARYVEMSGHNRTALFDAVDINALVDSHADAAERNRRRQCILNCVPFSGLASWRRPDGRENVYEFTAASFIRDGSYFIVGVDRDVTERRRHERRMQAQMDEILAVFNGIEGSMYVADMQTYELLAANQYCKEHYGPSVIGCKCYETLQKGQQQPCAFCTNHLLLDANGQPGPPVVWEFQNTKTDRWYRCIDRAIRWPDGRIVRAELAIDITALIEAQTAVRTSEINLAHAQRVAHIGSWTYDLATGQVSWSVEMRRIAGIGADDPAPPLS
jgi:PAS domain S-box-containing protein